MHKDWVLSETATACVCVCVHDATKQIPHSGSHKRFVRLQLSDAFYHMT